MKKRLFEAFKKTLLLFAFIHVFILVGLTFITGNITYLNIFSILDINVFIPGIEMGLVSQIISVIITGVIFFIYFKKS